MTRIYGAGGGGGKGGSSSRGGSTPDIDKDDLESTQYAQVIDLISEGEIEGLVGGAKGVFFDNTPLQADDGSFNFKEVQYYTRNGTQDQEPIPLGDTVEEEVPVGVLFDTQDQIAVRQITDKNVDAVRITISIPSLLRIEQDGDQRGGQIELTVEIQYDGGGYSEVIRDDIKGRTTNPYQRDYIINFTQSFSTAVDIKMRRVSQSAASKQSESNLLQYLNDFRWTTYTEIIRAKLVYPNSALFGARIDASQFGNIPARKYRIRGIKVKIPSNATVDDVNGRLIYSGLWDGTFGAAAWTTDPAWILWDLLTSTRYGFGDQILTASEKASFTGNASRLDKFAFYSASQYSSELVSDGRNGQEPRFSCNVNIQTAEEAYKLINDLCSVFRAMPYWAAGAMEISQDKPKDYSYLFTAANVGPDGFTYRGASRKTRPTVAVVSYLDLDLRDIAYEVVEDQAEMAKWGVVRADLSAFACTSRGQAARIGRWLLYSERYESESVSFTTSIDAGVVLRPGDTIKTSDPLRAGERRGGRIVSATTTAITVDDASGIPTGTVHRVMNVVMPDGTLEQRDVSDVTGVVYNFSLLTQNGDTLITQSGDTFLISFLEEAVVTVSSPFSVAPNPNSVWVLGTSDIQTQTWRVIGVQEQEDGMFGVTAIGYNSSKFDYIENGELLQERDVTNLNIIYNAPESLNAREVLYELNGAAKSKLLISWKPIPGVREYRVQWREADGNWQTILQQSRPDFEILDTSPGIYEVKVWSLNAALIPSPDPAYLPYTAEGKTAAPEDPTGLSLIANSDTTAILSWDRATDLDVILGGKVLIRHSNALTGATWSESQSVVAAAAGSQTQKQVPLLEGTYLIKFEDDTGNRSDNAAAFVVDLPEQQPKLLVENYRADEPYYILFDDFGLIDSIASNIDNYSLPAFSGTGSNMSYNASSQGLILDDISLGTGEFQFDRTVDFGGVFDVNVRRHLVTSGYLSGTLWDDQTSLIDTWSDIDGNIVSDVDAIMYIRATPDDPSAAVWGPWREFSNAVIRGRAFQFKVKGISENLAQNILVSEAGAAFELPQRLEAIGPLLTNDSGFTTVSFDVPFYEPPTISVVPYNNDGTAQINIANTSRTDFEVQFTYSDLVESRAFNYVAVGYGREII